MFISIERFTWFPKFLVVLAFALVSVLVVPATASATGYVPDDNIVVSGGGSVAPGGVVSITFTPGSFVGDSTADVRASGGAGFTLGAVVVVSKSYSVANGGFVIVVNVPATAAAGTA